MATYTTRNNIEKPAAADTGFPYTVNDNMDLIDDRIAKCNFSAATDPAVSDDSSDGYAIGSIWANTTGHKVFIAEDVTEGAAVWRQVWPALVADMANVIKADGTIALSANWDAGAHEIRAETLEADVATGTAPLTIASTTKVDNLNCDKLDDLEGAAYAILAGQSGGQTLCGGTGSGDDLTLESTAHATKGTIKLKGSTANVDPSLTYDTDCAAWVETGSLQLAMGCTTTSPYAFWMQTRQAVGVVWPLVLNPLGGKVGIGLSDPQAQLHLITDCLISGAEYPTYYIQSNVSGAKKWAIAGGGSDFIIRNGSDGINLLHIYNSGGMSLGSSVTDPGENNLYVTGDVNCASVTDHTPAYTGDAVAEIKSIKAKDGKIDHASLPKFCQKKYADAEGEKIGRDLGATISVLVEAVRQLTTRIEKLEAGGKNGVRRH